MPYYLYKLQFNTGLHIGDDSGRMSLVSTEMTIHGDTLFSALCQEALQLGGQALLDRLLAGVNEGSLLFSDAFPYQGDELYIPRPMLSVESRREFADSSRKKKFKALKYIPLKDFSAYLAGMKGGVFDPDNIQTEFGSRSTYTKVAIKGMKDNEGFAETKPYHVGIFRFFEQCGLYVLLSSGEDERQLFRKLITSLGYTGIGGKRTAGLGRFTAEEIELTGDARGQTLSGMLADESAPWQMSLSVALPRDDELDAAVASAHYTLVRRGGFVQSSTYAETPMKKKIQYFFAPGSCFSRRFSGAVYDVSYHGRHPVYRYAKPLFLGVNL